MKKYIEVLDPIRFAASILILFHHYQQVFGVHFAHVNFWGGVLHVGNLTELFFVISGFLAVMSTEKRLSAYWTIQNGLREWFHRAKRIYPMASLACLSYLFLAHVYRQLVGEWPDSLCDYADLKTILASMLLLFCGIPGLYMTGINNPSWYLCVLLLCYHLLFFFLILSSRLRIRKSLLFGLAILLALTGPYVPVLSAFVAGGAQRGYLSFFLGAALAEIFPTLSVERAKRICVYADAGLILAALLLCTGHYSGLAFFLQKWQRLALTFLLYPVLLLHVWAFDPVLNGKFRMLGKISFEIYLWHCVLFVALRLLLLFLNRDLPETFSMMMLVSLSCCLWAYVMLRWVEEPITRSLRSLEGASPISSN